MDNGQWDPNVLDRLEPMGDYLLVAPASKLIGYAGWQWISKAAKPGLVASAKEFRARTGRALYVAEAFRSIDTQNYYAAHPPTKNGAVARPGTSPHGLGLAVDIWSGINEGFKTPEHLAFAAASEGTGWTCTGAGFWWGPEPWHWGFSTANVDPAFAGDVTPIENEEDMPTTAEINDALFNDPRFRTIVNQETAKVVNGSAFKSAVADAAGPAASDALLAAPITITVDGKAQTGTFAQAVRDTRNLVQKVAAKLGA